MNPSYSYTHQNLIREVCAYLDLDPALAVDEGCLLINGSYMQLVENEASVSANEDRMFVRIQLAPPLTDQDSGLLARLLTANYIYGAGDCAVFSLMRDKMIPVMTYPLPPSAQLDSANLGDLLIVLAETAQDFWRIFSLPEIKSDVIQPDNAL